jgi:rSAM/selenodomain-associated transferase 1
LGSVAVAIVCRTPAPRQSKTRLSPPLRPDECAAISTCFIKDMTRTIGQLTAESGVTGYALYTPQGSEATLRAMLPDGFSLLPQSGDDLGTRLVRGFGALLSAGHDAAVLVGADSPTLPLPILRAAVDAVRRNDSVVLSPAQDGGYVLIGLSKPQPRLFENMPWSTDAVHRLTLDRARDIGLGVVNVPGWYDVDDAASLQMLEDELEGRPPAFASAGADAPATRQFLREWRQRTAAGI